MPRDPTCVPDSSCYRRTMQRTAKSRAHHMSKQLLVKNTVARRSTMSHSDRYEIRPRTAQVMLTSQKQAREIVGLAEVRSRHQQKTPKTVLRVAILAKTRSEQHTIHKESQIPELYSPVRDWPPPAARSTAPPAGLRCNWRPLARTQS